MLCKIHQKITIQINKKKRKYRNEEKGLTVIYEGRNPILRFIQKIINKLEVKVQQYDNERKRDPMDWYNQKFEQEMDELNTRKYSEYERIAKLDFDKSEKSTVAKAQRQLFLDKLSGNGAYQTFKKDSKNLSVPSKSQQDVKKIMKKEIEKDELSR